VKAGTIIRFSNGREGTVVYSGLDGYGIKWGRHAIPPEGVGGDSNLFRDSPKPPPGFNLFPDAMLREHYLSSELPCVGHDFEIVWKPE
jgi:hypothetical protein